MQLNLLLNAISREKPVHFVQMSNPKREIDSTRMLLDSDPVRRTDMLYICDHTYYKKLTSAQRRHGSFLVLGAKPEDVECHQEDDMNLILLPKTQDVPRIYNMLQDKFLLQSQVSAGFIKMTNALFSNRGVQHIVDVAYSLMKNPIFVSDSAGHYLASVYDEDTVELGSAFEGFILKDILYRQVDEGGQSIIRSMELDDILARTNKPYHVFHETFQKDAIFASIRVHNIVVGKIFTVAQEHPFTMWDEEYFTHLTTLIGQELQKNDAVVQNRYESESIALVNLLTSSYADEEVFSRCLATFRLPKNSGYRIALAGSSHPLPADTLSTLLSQFKSMLSMTPAAILDGHLVTFLYFPDEQGVSPYLLGKLEDFARHNGLAFGVSNLFRDYRAIRSAYYQALRAAFLSLDFQSDVPLSMFSDCSVLELLVSYRENKDAGELIHPDIAALQAHDLRYGTEYLKTLAAYLDVMCNSVAAASKLHIHKNTLLYRINKLTEAFHIDLTRGDMVMKYQLSLQVLDVMSRAADVPKSERDAVFKQFH